MASARLWGRLTRRPEFLRVAASRRRWAAPGLILQVAESPSSEPQSPFRLGFTASRKVGGAVQRNRAKRRLRAAAASLLPLYGRERHDYVLLARTATLSRPFSALLEDFKQALDAGHALLDRKAQRGRRDAT